MAKKPIAKPAAKRGTKNTAKKTPAKRTKAGANRAASLSAPETLGGPIQAFCRSLPGATEDVKWGAALVFSVDGKMFLVCPIEDLRQYCFNCDDDGFDRLVEVDGIIPAPYMARLGWVKVENPRALKASEAKRLIRRSYDIAVSKLPKRRQQELRAP